MVDEGGDTGCWRARADSVVRARSGVYRGAQGVFEQGDSDAGGAVRVCVLSGRGPWICGEGGLEGRKGEGRHETID